jgi:seryl-tRNA synthetase
MVNLVDRLEATISRLIRGPDVEVTRFPPVIRRETVERSGYHHAFTHLLGTVHAFGGDDAAHARILRSSDSDADWMRHQAPSDVALAPAACHAVYPQLTGTLPTVGRIVDVESWCYRHEPSSDPGRMRAFRMRELVRAGEPDEVASWRDRWIERGDSFLRTLGLEPIVVPASDPFFGRGAQLLAVSQQQQNLKFEIAVPVSSASEPSAVMSCNAHREHFGEAFGILTASGLVAHTACVAFGIERLAMALLQAHGLDPSSWPRHVVHALGSSPALADDRSIASSPGMSS